MGELGWEGWDVTEMVELGFLRDEIVEMLLEWEGWDTCGMWKLWCI